MSDVNGVHEAIDPFGAHVLEGATFRVNWNVPGKVAKKGREGGEYNAPCILTEIKGYVSPVWVELNRKDYDKLRLLKYQGITAYAITLGVKGKDERYAPRIITGALDW